eukprot:GEMP01001582.1.p1 GENE.GEMP01001582.1~~GEMP01001582.1.p1  ORF type:complete len:1140 (+),score=163.01 GEMP01001582.1:193-3612(+)
MLQTHDGHFASSDGDSYLKMVEVSSDTEIPVNSATATCISNEFFDGSVMLMHVPSTHNPEACKAEFRHQDRFEGKKRRWELQLQGSFKEAYFIPDIEYDPKAQPPGGPGNIYFGAEVEGQLSYGLVMGSVIRLCVGILRTFNGKSKYRMALNYAGVDGIDERPHIMYPLPYLPNKVFWTPKGEDPPVLGGKALSETPSMVAEDIVISRDQVYTFVFYTMYFNLVEWQVNSVPGLRDMAMEKFVGSILPMHISMYDDFKDKSVRPKNPHALRSRRVFIDIKCSKLPMKSLPPPSPVKSSEVEKKKVEEKVSTTDKLAPIPLGARQIETSLFSIEARDSDTPYSKFADAELVPSITVSNDVQRVRDSQADEASDSGSETSEARSDELQEQEFQSAHSDLSDDSDTSAAWKIDAGDPMSPSSAAKLQEGNRFDITSSAWLWGHKTKSQVRVNVTDNIASPWYVIAPTPAGKNRVRLGIWFLLEVSNGEYSSWVARSLNDVLELIQLAGDGSIAPYMKRSRMRRPLPDMMRPPTKKGKVVASIPSRPIEFVRKKLVDTLQTASADSKSMLVRLQREMLSDFLGIRTENMDDLDDGYTPHNLPLPPQFFVMLPHSRTAFAKALKDPGEVSGVVGSVVFEGRISEEFLSIQTANGTLKLWAPFVSRPRINVSIDTIISIHAPADKQGMIGRFYSFVIQTTLKSFQCVVPTQEVRDQFVQKTIDAIPRLQRASGIVMAYSSMSSSMKALVGHPLILDPSYCRRWVPANRLVLNDRRVVVGTSERITDIVKFSEALLNAALEFGGSSPQASNKADTLVFRNIDEFFQATGDLKSVSFEYSTATQRLAFWLNVYHTLMLHGFLQVGRPSSSKQMSMFQNRVSYLVESQAFSLTEIEFLILRSHSSAPLQRIRRLRLWGNPPLTSYWRREKEPLPSQDTDLLHIPRYRSSRDQTPDNFARGSSGADACDLHLEGLDGSDAEARSRKSGVSVRDIHPAFWSRYAPGYPEPRVNFVLCSGTLNCLDSIMVFNDTNLEELMNIASEHFMQSFCRIEGTQGFSPLRTMMKLVGRARKSVATRVTFPYCIGRFRKDINFASSTTWLEYVCRFLTSEKQDLVKNLPSNANVSIKYHKYRTAVHPLFKKMPVIHVN